MDCREKRQNEVYEFVNDLTIFEKFLATLQKNKIKYQYLLNQILDRTDNNDLKAAQCAFELIDMIVNKEIKVTIASEDKLLFILHSKYEGKCIRCGEGYTYGDPIFCCNKQAWHCKCRVIEEEKQSFFQTCLKKGLLEDYI